LAEIDEAAGLRVEVIKHLSSEIQNQSQYLMTFRSRIAFTVLIGPFIVLGSVLVAAKTTAANPWDWFDTILCVCLSIVYMCIGLYGSALDQHGIDKCDDWRRMLLSVSEVTPTSEKDTSELKRSDGKGLMIGDKARGPYLAGFALILLEFFIFGSLLLRLFPPASSTSSSNSTLSTSAASRTTTTPSPK
jgi:hypothetical protein